jgi:hypothetical protein
MPVDFSSVGLPLLVLTGFIGVILLYASYLSLSVRRGLVDPVYRRRAMWMGLFGLPFAGALGYGIIAYTLLPADSLLASPVLADATFTIAIITLLVWIDSMVGSAIHLDFLRRDVLHWRRLRAVYYLLVVAGNVFYFSRFLQFPAALALYSSDILLILAFSYGALALAIGARRTRDKTFRTYLKWFGTMGVAFLSALVAYSFTLHPSLMLLVPLLATSFCFYMMARNLVPIGKLTDEGFSVQMTPAEMAASVPEPGGSP